MIVSDFKEGDKASASKLQNGSRAIRALQRSEGEQLHRPLVSLRFFARIVKTGPLGTEADYTDERYWIKPLYAKGAGVRDILDLQDDKFTLFPNEVVTASNLSEWEVVTHCIPQDSVVEVYCFTDRGDPYPVHHYVFHASPQLVFVKVTGNETGGGKYVGKVWNPVKNNVSATGNLTEAEIGTSGADCRILNAAEVGQSTHDLTSGTPKSKIFPGMVLRVNDDDLKLVVVINGRDWEACT
jgi:hypothetical protein